MFPCACQRDDLSGGLLRRAVGRDDNEPFETPQPLALISGVPSGANDQRLDRLLARQRRHLLEADDLPRGCRRLEEERVSHLLLDSAVEHSSRPFRDPPVELGLWQVEADDERRMPPGAGEQHPPARYERPARLRELERPDDTTAVVGMHTRRSPRVELA